MLAFTRSTELADFYDSATGPFSCYLGSRAHQPVQVTEGQVFDAQTLAFLGYLPMPTRLGIRQNAERLWAGKTIDNGARS